MHKLLLLLALTVPAAQVQAAPILWNADSDGNLGTVDVATGAVNLIGNMGVVMTDIAFDPSGNLFGISFSDLYSIDSGTATVSLIGSHGTQLNSLVFDSSGNLFSANTSLYKLSTITGASTYIGSSGGYSSSGDLAFIGSDLLLTSSTGSDSLFKLDVGSGAGTLVGSIGFSSVYGLASPDNSVLYGASGTDILSIDPLTGVGVSLLNYGGQGLGSAFGTAFFGEAGPSPIPIPASFPLILGGIAALMAVRRTKRA